MIFILLILILSISFACIFDEKILEAAPLSVFSVIAAVYISGLMSDFLPGLFCVAVLPVVLFIGSVLKKRISLETLKSEKILYFGSVEYVIVLLVLFVFTYGLQFASWDEFSHWGIIVKWFYYINDFATADNSSIYFLSYPPGISVFAYVAEKLSGSFREGTVYFAYDVFMMSLLFPIFRIVEEKGICRKNIALGATLPFIPMLFSCDGLKTCYSEMVLGVLIGYILLTYLTMEDSSLKWLNMGMAFFTLTIIKEAGFGLAVIVLIIILVCELSCFRRIKHVLFMALPVLIGKISWDMRLRAEDISKKAFSMGHSFDTIIKQKGLFEYQKETIINFGKKFYGGDIGSLKLYSGLAWLIIVIIVIMLISETVKKEYHGKQYVIALWGMAAGFIIYSASLLTVYLTNLSEREAVSTASFERYIMIYILGASIVLIYTGIQFCSSRYILSIIAGIVWIQVLLGAALSQWMDIDDIYRTSNYSYLDGSAIQDIPMDEKVCFVHYSDAEGEIPLLSNLIFRTYYTPHKSVDYTLAWHDDSGEVSMSISPEEWIDYLSGNNCEYVYLDDIDDGFISIYGKLFEDIKQIKDRTLFKIDHENNRLILASEI